MPASPPASNGTPPAAPARWPTRTPTAPTRPAPSSTACRPTRPASSPDTETIHFPKSCLHCEDPPCVPVCPTGASYKRKEDGIVLVDYDKCIGCKYCAWACPYGARELDEERQVMTKCTLCVDRIYDEKLPKEDRKPACVKACPTGARLFGDVKDPDSEVSKAIRERGGYSLMPEWETQPGQPVPAAAHDRDRRRRTSRPSWAGCNEPGVLGRLLHHHRRRGAGPGRHARARACSRGLPLAPAFVERRADRGRSACCSIGLGASFVHLGRPERAWRAVLMWRTSWLSREVIVLPAFIAVVALWWLALRRGVDAPLLPLAAIVRRRAALVLHRDDLRLPALHPGMGAAADARQLRADRPVVGPGAAPARWPRSMGESALLQVARRRARWSSRSPPGPRARWRCAATPRCKPRRRCSRPPASARRSWCRSRWACRPARSTRASSSTARTPRGAEAGSSWRFIVLAFALPALLLAVAPLSARSALALRAGALRCRCRACWPSAGSSSRRRSTRRTCTTRSCPEHPVLNSGAHLLK